MIASRPAERRNDLIRTHVESWALACRQKPREEYWSSVPDALVPSARNARVPFLRRLRASRRRREGIECPERLAMAASARAARCSRVSPRTANLPSGAPIHQNYFGAAVFACSWASTLCAVSSDRFARASQLAASTKGCGSPGLRVASSLARS